MEKNSGKLNFAFWGTPDVASATLEILKSAGYLPSLVVTSPDARAGRKMLMTPPPAKVWAMENNIPFIQPEKLEKEEIYDVLRTSSQRDGARKAIFQQENMRGEQNIVDFFLVVAYGKIIPEKIINLPRFGSINIHYSLLPKYRGASPVESAILNGDTETGVTIQQMQFELDKGSILAQEKTPIEPDEKAPDLRKRLIEIGGNLLVKILPDLMEGKIKSKPQDENQATHCAKIKKEDGLINLNDNATKNYNKFRAYTTWPRTFFFSAKGGSASGGKNGKRLIITKAKLENGKFIIEKVIPEGGKETDYRD